MPRTMFSFQAGGKTCEGSDTSSRYLVDAEAAIPTEHRRRAKPEAALPTKDRFRELTQEVQERPESQAIKDRKAIARVEALVSRSRFPYQIREDAWLVKPSVKAQPIKPVTVPKVQVDQAIQVNPQSPIVFNREKKVIPIVAPTPRQEAKVCKLTHKSEGPDRPIQVRKPGKRAIPIVAPTPEREAHSSSSSNQSADEDRNAQPKKPGKKAVAIVRPTPEWEAQEAQRKAKEKDPGQTMTANSRASRASQPSMDLTPNLAEPAVKSRTKSAPAELASPSRLAPSPEPSVVASDATTTGSARPADERTSPKELVSPTKTALVHPLPSPVFHPSLWLGRKED